MKISRFPAAAAWAMTLALALPTLGAEKGVSLRPKLTKGATTRFTVTAEGTNTTRADAFAQGQMTQTINREVRVAHRVIEANDSGAVIELTYERIKIEVKAPALNMNYAFDSQSPASKDAGNAVAEAMRPLVGATITLTLGTDGQITSVKAPQNLAKPGRLGGLPHELLDPTFVKKTYGGLYCVNNPVFTAAPGETWSFNESRELFAGTRLNIGYSYKLSNANGNDANISFTGKAEVVAPAPNANKGDERPKLDLKEAKFEGSVVWDSKAGMARSCTRFERTSFAMDPNQGSPMSNETALRETITRAE